VGAIELVAVAAANPMAYPLMAPRIPT
jgi:hypothetical protein